jgi:hypothetical protein
MLVGASKFMNKVIGIITFGKLFVPGAWAIEIVGLIGIFILGKFLFNQQDTRSKVFWNGVSILSILEILRLLF